MCVHVCGLIEKSVEFLFTQKFGMFIGCNMNEMKNKLY